MSDRSEGLLLWGLCIVLLAAVGYSAYWESKRWDRFASEHHCKVVGRQDSSLAYGFSGKNFTTIVEPGKTGYLCDDGVTYWR